jgi:predicted nuclease of predicted toxin-antitoxin system
MRLLFDQNVPEEVVEIFRERGHEINYSREVLLQNSPDQLIAIGAALDGMIVVTHDKDYRRYSSLFPQGFRTQARKITGRILLNVAVDQPEKVHVLIRRTQSVIEEIEFHYGRSLQSRSRLLLSVTETGLSVTHHARNP